MKMKNLILPVFLTIQFSVQAAQSIGETLKSYLNAQQQEQRLENFVLNNAKVIIYYKDGQVDTIMRGSSRFKSSDGSTIPCGVAAGVLKILKGQDPE
jgi:hypothetical protein